MQQLDELRKGLDEAEVPSAAFTEPIPEKRAAVLASGAMQFSHKLLAVVHKEDQREIKETFKEWYKRSGRKLLSMDPKHVSEFKAESEDEEEGSDFEDMPPASPSPTALQPLARSNMFPPDKNGGAGR